MKLPDLVSSDAVVSAPCEGRIKQWRGLLGTTSSLQENGLPLRESKAEFMMPAFSSQGPGEWAKEG